MVLLIFAAFILAALSGLVYLLCRFHRFLLFDRWREYWQERKRWSWIVSSIPILALILYCVLDMVNGVVVTVNLVVIWLLADLIGWIAKKITKKTFRYYWAGIGAIVFSAAYLGSGWYFAHHVYETDYQIETEKELGMDQIRVVQISDSHIGATFDGDGFAKHMEKIQQTNPDLIVITGDYVDDDTTREDLVKCSTALGKMKTKYGIYYIYGNHDKGYFNTRDFNDDDIRSELKKNNVKILEDETVEIGDHIYLIGRKDRSEPEREDMQALTDGLDMTKYVIVLDHQPHDFDQQTEAGVDLVLCGHTHGGQMFPVGITGELTGANDKTYGQETRGKTNFIVNSGISDWAIDYKTGGAI